MLVIKVVDRLTAEDGQAVRHLLAQATTADDHPALSDDHLIALEHATDPAPTDGTAPTDGASPTGGAQERGRFLGFLASDGGELVGYGQALASADHAVGSADLGPGLTWSIATAVDPGSRSPGLRVAEELAGRAVTEIGRRGGGLARLWAYQAGSQAAAAAARMGFEAERTLYQMRRPLPVAEPFSLTTRAFQPGVDEDEWIRVNNRAFAWHPEQSGWTLAAIQAHEAETWFDPAGFLLHEVDGRLAGFCWTKIHDDTDPRLGEIYVIAADPDFAGRGLGRQLVLAGLAHLAAQGITVAMLYTEADNKAAVKLYVNLDFIVDHLDRSFTQVVPAQT